MTTRLSVALLTLLALAGCTAEEPGAAEAVKSQICTLAADDQVTAPEIAALGKVLDRAHQLGLPDEILNPSHNMVTTGKATAADVKTLKNACA